MNGRTELAIRDLKLLKSEQQGNRCPRCGNTLPVNAQLAHKINQGSRNIRKYGLKIIHHPLNMDLTCPGRCNSLTLIDNKPEEKKALLDKIIIDLEGSKNGKS